MKQHFVIYFIFSILTVGINFLSYGNPIDGRNVIIKGTILPEEKINLREQFLKTYSLLPPKMKMALEQDENFSSYTIVVANLPKEVAGEINSQREITINSKLLHNPKLLNRTFIHELSHIYDLLGVLPSSINKLLLICQSWGLAQYPPDYCELYKNVNTSVSSLPSFLDVTGWYQSFSKKGERIDEPTFSHRSPDFYELKNPREMFAVNMEYFLTDAEYQCRRPTLNAYLSEYFSFKPFEQITCSNGLTYIDPHFNNAEKALQTIDTKRVYAVHYLMAGNGDDLSSSYGHSMIRLVICSPSRTSMGPDCLQDFEYHLVLSFRGFVDNPQSNVFSGLSGDYPSRLFFLPFAQVINEYNVNQLRDLYSYPMKLNTHEIASLLQRAVETHWSYKSKYYFLTNNCAIETLNFLKSALQKEKIRNLRTQTPLELLQELKRNKLIDSQVKFNDSHLLQREGYFFPSHSKNLNKALNLINEISSENFSLSEWLEKSPDDRRTCFLKNIKSSDLVQKKWTASFLFLERYIEKSLVSQIYESLLDETHNTLFIGNRRDDFLNKVLKTFSFNEKLTSPSSLTLSGYGIPNSNELNQVRKKLKEIATERDTNQNSINLIVNDYMNYYQNNELSKIRDNILLFTAGLTSKLNQ